MEIPCKDCLILPICKSKVKRTFTISSVSCSFIDKYIFISGNVPLRKKRLKEFHLAMGFPLDTFEYSWMVGAYCDTM